MSLPRAASALEVAAVAAGLDGAGQRGGDRVVGHDGEALLTRLASIGWPMVPVPMNPIFMRSPLGPV